MDGVVETRASATAPTALWALVGALLLVAFGPTLLELVGYWWQYPEYSHGFLIPVIAGGMLWSRRRQIAAAYHGPSLVGALLVVPCVAILLLGEMKLSWFLKPYAFVAALGAVVWALFGRRTLAAAVAPWLVLFLMCPLPGRVQNAMTVPLKQTAALFATGMLDLTGFDVTLDGNLIRMPGIHDLWVADACSGIRSLISLVTLAILACTIWKRPWPLKVAVVVLAIPIAVLVNGLRIWLTGVIAAQWGPAAAESFFHFFEGFALFALAGLLLWGAAALVDRMFGPSAA
jgi:exosortase